MKTTTGLILAFLLCYSPLRSQDAPAVSYIQSVSVDYSDPNIVYAASRGQGLFKSTDAGESWVLKCYAAKNKNFNIVIPDPKTPQRVFAGGQESGLLLSTDQGETWEAIGLEGQTINDIAIDKNNPRRIFVLANQGVYSNQDIETQEWVLCFDHNQYLRDSTDLMQYEKAERFGKYGRFGSYGRFKKIAVSPFYPNTIVVGANWEAGFFRSDDGGETWRHETISGIFRRVDVIYFHPSEPDVFYVGTHHQGLFKTYNFGKSWTPLSDGLEPQIRSPYYGAYLISGFAPDPTDPDVFYSGSDYSNWKTIDGGEHWFELGRSLTCEFVRSMAVDPLNPAVVYAGSNVGMYKSTDGGKSWRAVNSGFQEATIQKIIRVSSGENKFQFALSERYPFVFRKSESGSWTAVSWLLPEYGVETAKDLYFNEAEQVLVLVTDHGDFISRDYGLRWMGETPHVDYVYVKSAVKELRLEHPDFDQNYVLAVQLDGDVFFDDSLVDSLYRRPPYISLQLVEAGYPYNGMLPAWSMNVDDCLKATVEIPKTAVKPGKKYYLYAEVRDFQKNYKTAFSKIKFGGSAIIPVSMTLEEGFCLKKHK